MPKGLDSEYDFNLNLVIFAEINDALTQIKVSFSIFVYRAFESNSQRFRITGTVIDHDPSFCENDLEQC